MKRLADTGWTVAVAVVATLTIAFVATFGFLGRAQFWRFHSHAFDLGIFAQGTWLLSRFEDPFVTVRGLPLFADHSSYILILVAPLYWIFPTAATLVAVTVLALAATAPLAFVVARRAGARPLLATATAALVLLHPAVQWNVRDGFHPEVLVVPLVVGAIALLQRDKDMWGVVVIVIALTAKEDVGLLIAPLGAVVWWVLGKRRIGLIIAGLGVGAFLLNFFVLLPAWSPSGELLYSYRYAHIGDGFVGITTGLATDPSLWLETFTDPRKLGYLAVLLLGMPLAVLGPRWLLAGIPVVFANLFTTHAYQFDIRFHYTSYLIAVVVIAGAFGAGWISRRGKPWLDVTMLAVMILSAGLTWGFVAPTGWVGAHDDHAVTEAILDEIPDDAAVSAWTTFVPHLANRTTVYLFPNPWSEANYGTPGPYCADGGDIPDPEEVEYVFIRLDSYTDFDHIIEALVSSPKFEVVVERGPFLLLRRIG